ncbi:hypothetical protein SB6411_03202 [Klebsiella spallanzanii]|uniref:Transposase (putative) YhgA-like domain-containing protein n=1 Tax=Klebsiella spallanzanii TaxID=2587528 RepID=A0ABY6VHP3_9ENTR|nr:hypothetical protein SB6411_03202 [Klebsiella spallanzanii]
MLETQDPDRNSETIFSEQRTKLVGQRRSLLNHQLTCIPKRLDILLFCGFYRNKVNTWAKCCLTNCQRIIGIIFLATDKSFYVLCGDESDAIAHNKHMAFRLIRYAVVAMQRHLEAGHKKLPLVIPVLFYTGKRSPYPYSTRWLDEFDDPCLAGTLYSSAFPLVDVTVIPDDDIAGHRSMAALTLLQKHIHQRDLAELVDRLAPILLAGYLSSSQVISLVHYIVQAGETADAEAFVRELALRVPQHGDALMTIAQQLEQKGIEKGIQLGKQRGIEKGRSEGERQATLKIARTMLQNGIDRSTVMKMTGLSEEDLAQIRH